MEVSGEVGGGEVAVEGGGVREVEEVVGHAVALVERATAVDDEELAVAEDDGASGEGVVGVEVEEGGGKAVSVGVASEALARSTR